MERQNTYGHGKWFKTEGKGSTDQEWSLKMQETRGSFLRGRKEKGEGWMWK